MDEGNRGNLEIHRTNAEVLCAQALEFASRLLIKRYHIPTRKEVKQP